MTSKKGRPANSSNELKREALIAAARVKFVQKDYDKVSIRELAELANVNSAMIKYYFQSKEGLYKAMVEDVTGQVMSNIKQRLAAGQFDSIEGFFRSFVEVIKQSPEFPMLMLKEMVLGQGICRDYFVERIGRAHISLMDQLFNHFKQAGMIREDVDSRFFRMSLIALTNQPWHMRELAYKIEGIVYDDEFLEQLIQHNTQLIQHGCFKPQMKGENDGE